MERVVVNKPKPLDPVSKEDLKRVQLAFGQRLRQLRHDKLMTIEQVAEIADIHPNYLSSVERGKRNVSLFNIWRIANGLGLTTADLTGALPVRTVMHLVTEPSQAD
nr:helix-turn-helix transcriptional regulator [Rhodoferax sp.]